MTLFHWVKAGFYSIKQSKGSDPSKRGGEKRLCVAGDKHFLVWVLSSSNEMTDHISVVNLRRGLNCNLIALRFMEVSIFVYCKSRLWPLKLPICKKGI